MKWAMAGRSKDKLASVRDAIGAPADTPLIVADAGDAASLKAMLAQTKSVISTVGPYQLYGNELIAACVESGTDYFDLCGEPVWMRQMIDKYEAAAKASGARIVFSCGFDSVPFELGAFFVQEEARRVFGAPAQRVKSRVRDMNLSRSLRPPRPPTRSMSSPSASSLPVPPPTRSPCSARPRLRALR